MSAATIEVTSLEDMPGLDEVPPCEAILRLEKNNRCGKPSVVRVRVSHVECGMGGSVFLCHYCLGLLRRRWVRCGRCGEVGDVAWSET